MCGITGFYNLNRNLSQEASLQLVKKMSDAIQYRGPDDGNVWADASKGIAFGHRRLSIVDLSSAGAQPMESQCKRYMLVYNGEVYNAEDIRSELPPMEYRGHSDTEVILAGIAHWGVEQTVSKLIGMFALALWDKHEETLYLVRDRLGIKPLYWGCSNGTYLFGSELKAIWVNPSFDDDIDRNAIGSFLRHNYIPGPNSIFSDIKKLQPGHMITIKSNGSPIEKSYWSMEQVVQSGYEKRKTATEAELVDELENLLRDAVKRRMVSDVPLGAFLSGGIDSSTVAALMQAQSDKPIKTFSIGFSNQDYNEADHAANVAGHLKTDHTELYVDYQEARDTVPLLSSMYDEPFADSSQIPTFLVSKMTRKEVTVALSGDGGDEVFAGYNRYTLANNLWKRFVILPGPLRKGLGLTLSSISPGVWDKLFGILPASLQRSQAGDKIHKLAGILNNGSNELYRSIISHWQNPSELVVGGEEYQGILFDEKPERLIPNHIERMQYLDTVTYLPDDILTKVDRASMAVSLEARVPLLDHRVVEFAWALPLVSKIKNGESKWILRQVLDRYIPRELMERPKMGFGVPIGDWLRGPLRDWAEDLLDDAKLKNQGFLKGAPIRQRWDEHLSGRRNWQYSIWTILMFQSWLESRKNYN